jgi:hypothetical protein
MVRQRRWSTAVEGARDVTEWACYSTSFLLTGVCARVAAQLRAHPCPALVLRTPPCPPAPRTEFLPAAGSEADWRLPPWRPPPSLSLPAGNLLAPYLTAVTSDLLFSSYQRLKARQVERSQARALATIRDLQRTALALKDARKAALQPPPPGAAKREEEAGREEEGSRDCDSSSEGGRGGSEGSSSSAPHVAPDQRHGSDDAQAGK